MSSAAHRDNSVAARPGRFRVAWQAAHEPLPGVSPRLRLTAYAVPLVVLPSSLWRLPVAFDQGSGWGERLYILSLSVVSELLAFTAIGLIARWGEVFPRWIPGLSGSRVPTKAAVIPAALGATILTLAFTVLAIVNEIQGTTIRGDDRPSNFPAEAGGWEAAWFYVCYTPLILWGPLLAVLTLAYYKRRRGTRRGTAQQDPEPASRVQFR
ncbi:hypothetical protein [Streptomyces sp. CMB-StM0423]|uniref:hypothetical protein n=1 Tax=Streptomyces sp. CMB-StM0423 TaxID=2059884 RepID=UPI000C7097A8|nr:hypothetical protein [Streptomyces sp. CMB-StM0423]AUH43687.1 hypothetical protein CXR04_29060 [Streptomyces sp. CMB-StM0423]